MSLHNVSVIRIHFIFSHPYVFVLGIHSVVVCPFLQGHFSFYEKKTVYHLVSVRFKMVGCFYLVV